MIQQSKTVRPDLKPDVERAIREQFRHNMKVPDHAVSGFLKEGTRALSFLQGLASPSAATTTPNATTTSTTSNEKASTFEEDEADRLEKQGRVGKGWPWEG